MLVMSFGLAVVRIELMGWARATVVTVRARWARLSETGQGCAERKRGADCGQGFLHVRILCWLTPGDVLLCAWCG